MVKIFITAALLSVNLLYAKKDFYYGYINSAGDQISEKEKQNIIDGYDTLKAIKELVRVGEIGEAYSWIKEFDAQNKLKLLKSDITLLHCEILLKRDSKRLILEGADILEKAINTSVIHEEDLPKAYMLIIDLFLGANKAKDATFFANKLINTYGDPLTNAYGKIYLAKIYGHKREYKKAQRILYEILTETNDLTVATVVADKLFEVYLADDKRDKAYELISKVLEQNINYYADDSYLALKKVNRLINIGMPDLAIKILQELIARADKPSAIEDFKFKLANTYMGMYDRFNEEHPNLNKAKEIYKDLYNDFPGGSHIKKVKMFIDEILMREGKIEPAVMVTKYQNSESMQQKVLVQELLNNKKRGNFSLILRQKKIYKKISNLIAKRFGYKDMNEVFDEVNILMIKDYLNIGECILLKEALETARRETLITLIEDDETKFKFFQCMVEAPYKRAYILAKDAFKSTRDALIYYYLEQIALGLDLVDEAYDYSAKVDMVNNKEVLEKEFLTKFLVYGKRNDATSMDKFFMYASLNKEYIEANKDNPIIVDFYFQYYLYLLKKDKKEEALEILKKLYDKQKEFKARVYSPFVENELSKEEKNKKNYKKSINYLEEALKETRSIKTEDLAKIYYEMAKLYEITGNNDKYSDVVLKCQELKGIDDNIYKSMCDRL